MTDERVAITNTKDVEALGFASNILGMTLLGQINSGYGSIGSAVSNGHGDKAYLRLPHCDHSGSSPQEIYDAYVQSGTRGVISVIALDEFGNTQELPYDSEDPLWGEKRELSDVVAVAMLLQLLPASESLSNIVNRGEDRDVLNGYVKFGITLKDLHETTIQLDPEIEEYWRRVGSKHPIEGRERLLAIRPFVDISTGWINDEKYQKISLLMSQVAETMINEKVAVGRTHGDAWRDNVLITAEDAVLFDNALKYGPLGNDVGFAIGDRILALLTKPDDISSQLAIEGFLEGYGNEEILKDVFVSLGFKAVVGASFDNYSTDDKAHIIRWITRLLEEKIKNSKLCFSIDLAKRLWVE